MSVSFLFQTKTVFFTRQRTYRLLSPLVILTFIPYLCQEKPASRCSALCILGIYVHSGASFSSRLPDDRRMSGSRAVTRCQFFKEGFLYGFGGFQKMPSSQKKQIFNANRQMTYVLQSLSKLQLKSTQIDWQLTTQRHKICPVFRIQQKTRCIN